MAQEQGFLQHRFSRRDLPKYTVTAGLVLKTVFEAACAQNPPRPEPPEVRIEQTLQDEANIFPQGVFLAKEHFTQEMYWNLIDASETFPEIAVEIGPNRDAQIDLQKALPNRRDIIEKSRITDISFIQTPENNFGIGLAFDDVFLGREFRAYSTSSPAIIFARRGEQVLSAGSDPFDAWSSTRDSSGQIGFMNLPFPVPLEKVIDSDLLVIFNKGLFGHQANSAVLLPIKFKMTQSRGVI